MTAQEFEEALIAWGRLYGNGKRPPEERSLTGNSTLSRIGGKPKQEADRNRYGAGRRKIMGKNAGLRGMLPPWACDPVSGTETRSFRPTRDDPRETPILERLDWAWLALWRRSEYQATIVRLHYQERRLNRDEKAAKLGIPLNAYRTALKSGKAAIYAKIAEVSA